jgi:hypothetical protein
MYTNSITPSELRTKKVNANVLGETIDADNKYNILQGFIASLSSRNETKPIKESSTNSMIVAPSSQTTNIMNTGTNQSTNIPIDLSSSAHYLFIAGGG